MSNVTLFGFPRSTFVKVAGLILTKRNVDYRLHDTENEYTQQITAAPWRTLVALWSIWDALRAGLAAHRRYEHLRSRGIPHDPALREALGIGRSPAQLKPGTAPLGFAGKA
jgi:hypothetical protein